MKNPLFKRLPYILKDEIAKYLIIFLFMAGSIGLISGFLVADGSMIKAYNDSFDKYNIEDGHFRLNDSLSKENKKALEKGAMFDSRCFNIPKEEVANLIFWRQFDASKNSVQMVEQAYFTQEELNNKNTNQIQDMLITQKGINWNDYPTYQKRGSCCIKRKFWIDKNDGCKFSEEYSCELEKAGVNSDNAIKKTEWIIDKNIPIFKGENRRYINELILFKE